MHISDWQQGDDIRMNKPIDIAFNTFSDTPPGKDPDTFSPRLRSYHKLLWSMPLPDGPIFELTDTHAKAYLYHQSELGEFFLSSDAIGHTYRHVKRMSHIVDQVSPDEIESFFNLCTTIGGYIIFPSNKIDRKMTINGARGLSQKIGDRFDLTLECIRRHYANEDSPLGETLRRYSTFFDLFRDFRGYVDFFLLQDLVSGDYSTIKFWSPFDNFGNSPFLNDVDEYHSYKKRVINFISARNQRIHNSVSESS